MGLSDVDDEDTSSTHEQLAEFPDGAIGSDGVYYIGEQWGHNKESFEQDEEDVRTTGGHERQDDHCTKDQQRRHHVNQRGDVSCVVVPIWPRTVPIGSNRPERLRSDRKTNKDGKNGEVDLVRSVARRRGFNESYDEYNPFDVFSPSEKLCHEKACLSDWNQWRRHLIEIHSKLDPGEFEIMDCDDERPALHDRLVPIPAGTPNHQDHQRSQLWRQIEPASHPCCDGAFHDL